MPPPLCTTSGPAPDEAFPTAAANTNLGKEGRGNREDNTEGGGRRLSSFLMQLPISLRSRRLTHLTRLIRERPHPAPFAPDPFPSPGRAASQLHYHVDLVLSLHISDRLACGVVKARLTQRTNKLCGLKPEPANDPLRGCCSRQTSIAAASKPAVSQGHGTVYGWLPRQGPKLSPRGATSRHNCWICSAILPSGLVSPPPYQLFAKDHDNSPLSLLLFTVLLEPARALCHHRYYLDPGSPLPVPSTIISGYVCRS